MLDPAIRRLIDPPLDAAGRKLAAAGTSANAVTIVGLAIGLMAVPLLAAEAYGGALVAILAGRLADGLDGAVARHRSPTLFGGYLDITCDFLFYAAVPFGFALARPENALPAAFLIVAFVGTGTTFLAYAVLAARHGLETTKRGRKAFYYLGGLTEGTETIAAFAAFCLFPDAFPTLAWTFGGLCAVTALARIWTAYRDFGR